MLAVDDMWGGGDSNEDERRNQIDSDDEHSRMSCQNWS